MLFLPILLWTGWLAMACAAENENERQYQHEREREHTNLRSRHLQHRLLQQQTQTTTGNPFDIVFIMDESIGMSLVQGAFKSMVPKLFSHLATRAPGSRAGLVGYEYHTAHTLQELTSSLNSFWYAASMLVSGITPAPTSPGYDAIYMTVGGSSSLAESLGYTKNRPFCVVLFTNKPSTIGIVNSGSASDALRNKLTVRNAANARGVFFGVTSSPGISANYSYSPIAMATGGKMYDLFSNITYTANDIVMACNIAVNQITLTPNTANLTAGDTHTLTIVTRMRVDNALFFKPNATVILRAWSGPNAGVLFNGTTNGNGIRQVSFKPTSTLNMARTFNFEACLVDTPTACVTAAATWNPNRPPVANNDANTTHMDTAVIIPVTANDVDPNGDLLVVAIQTQPAHGYVSVNSDGTVNYRPLASFVGRDFFTYKVSDGRGGTSLPATVTINVNCCD